ncbi:MAG TPA: uroporphyrinogen decarboxylase family protein [Clostridia bacterium]|nr:uroporphyrinogen decarboxylase family protein [Clostridia bacterium]
MRCMMRDFEQLKKMTTDFYSIKPDAPIALEEFGYYSKEEWIRQGHIRENEDLNKLFKFERLANYYLPGLSGTTAPFIPRFKEEIIGSDDTYEIAKDKAGRTVKYFKGKRDGFMPQYLDFPVKDLKTWKDIEWRLDYNSAERNEDVQRDIIKALPIAKQGYHLIQYIVGAFMYLRSLIGGEEILYMIYDEPALIHTCMKKWLELSDYITAKYQDHVRIDELLFDEDICYNHGSLISPAQIRSFLFPYYKELIQGVRNRNNRLALLDKNSVYKQPKGYDLIIHVATDGDCRPVIPVYKEIGMNYMSPMEVASGCDVVQIRKDHPDIRIKGGIDKRILAHSKEAIKIEIDRILPFMKKHGGYLPTCDHGVPAEVPFENYVYFRELLREYTR